MKSAAVVNFAPEKGSVEIREIEKPTIGAEDVLLEVVGERVLRRTPCHAGDSRWFTQRLPGGNAGGAGAG